MVLCVSFQNEVFMIMTRNGQSQERDKHGHLHNSKHLQERELIEKLEERKFAKKWIKEKRNRKKKIAEITSLSIKYNAITTLKNLLSCGVRIQKV